MINKKASANFATMKKLILKTEDDLDLLVAAYLQIAGDCKITFLYGDLGAGKTTFVKRLCRHLGCNEEASSPTYSLINEYVMADDSLYHIDLYRLEDEDQAIDIGIEDYLYSGHRCMIEWPQVIERLVDQHVTIRITTLDDESRSVEIELINP